MSPNHQPPISRGVGFCDLVELHLNKSPIQKQLDTIVRAEKGEDYVGPVPRLVVPFNGEMCLR